MMVYDMILNGDSVIRMINVRLRISQMIKKIIASLALIVNSY